MIDLRDIDKKVAKLIMGWAWNNQTAYSASGDKYERFIIEDPYGPYPNPWWWLPHYSSDMSSAWLIVERLQRGVVRPEFELIQIDTGWACTFDKVHYVFSFGKTAPLAICEAALKLKGFNVEFYV